MDKVITKSELSLLRRIIAADDLHKSLLVTFDSKNHPVEKFDLHSSEVSSLEEKKYIEYVNLDARDLETPGGILDHQTSFVFISGDKVSGIVQATNLGRYISEEYEREDTRYEQTNRNSRIALWLSSAAILVSILVAIFK